MSVDFEQATPADVLAAQSVVKAAKRLGETVDPDIVELSKLDPWKQTRAEDRELPEAPRKTRAAQSEGAETAEQSELTVFNVGDLDSIRPNVFLLFHSRQIKSSTASWRDLHDASLPEALKDEYAEVLLPAQQQQSFVQRVLREALGVRVAGGHKVAGSRSRRLSDFGLLQVIDEDEQARRRAAWQNNSQAGDSSET